MKLSDIFRKPERYICISCNSSMNQPIRESKGMKEKVDLTQTMDKVRDFFERYSFGVCAQLGEFLGVATSSIRLFFIYASFITFGSPVIIYLSLAFIVNMRKHLRRRTPIWDY